jgi:hypothetical protein
MAYGNLKPSNIVLVRYENKDEVEFTFHRPCYKIKLINLSSITYLKDINEYQIKKDILYP